MDNYMDEKIYTFVKLYRNYIFIAENSQNILKKSLNKTV